MRQDFDGIPMYGCQRDGIVDIFDKNGRLCWTSDEPERVYASENIKTKAVCVLNATLGWTVPGTTDGYKSIDVTFDDGLRLTVRSYRIQRVVASQAKELAAKWLAEMGGTNEKILNVGVDDAIKTMRWTTFERGELF